MTRLIFTSQQMVENCLKMLHEYYFENVTIQCDEYLGSEWQTKEHCSTLEFGSAVPQLWFPSQWHQHWRLWLLVKNLRVIFSGLTKGNYQSYTRQISWESCIPNARLGAQTTHNALQSPKGVTVKDSGPLDHHALSSINSHSSGAFIPRSPHLTPCVEGSSEFLLAVTFLGRG